MRGRPTVAEATGAPSGPRPDGSRPTRTWIRRVVAAVGGPWVVVAVVAAAVLWCLRLGTNPLFVDEAASWSVAAQDSLGSWWSLLLRQEVAPPPFYAGLRGVVELAGASGHVALRLPVVLLTLPAVPLAAVLARRCGGSPRAIAGAAWLVAASPLMLMYAQQSRAYGPAATAVLVAALLVTRVVDLERDRATATDVDVPGAGPTSGGTRVLGAEPHRRPARVVVAAGVALGLAPWVHYVAWLPAVPLLVAALVGAGRRPRVVLAAIVGPLWAGAATVAIVQYGHVGAGMDGVTELGGDDLLRVVATAWDGRFAGGTPLLALGAVGLAAGCAAAVVLRRTARLIALAGLAGPIGIVVVSALGPDIVTTRYLVPCAPLLLVGIALLADRLPARPGVVGLALLGALGLAGAVRTLTPSTGDYPDFERTAGYVVPSLRPGTVVASESFFLGTWIPEYVAARAGVPGVRSAWGQGQLVPELCARRRILQLSDPAAAEPARAYLAAAGYVVRVAPTPSPDQVLLTAEPRGPVPSACIDTRS